MRRPRLVASDVDGTLLDPIDEISARTRAAVHRVVAAGLPGAKLAVELSAGSAATNGFDQFLAEPGYTHPWPGADSETASRDLILGRPAIKLLVRQADASSEVMAAAVGELLGAALAVTYSTGYGLIELSAPGVTKGTGLARLAGELGIASAD